MPTLSEVMRDHTRLTAEDRQWVSLLLADWQILADLSFADLVLWLPDRDGRGHWAVAQMRPTTGPTAIVDDVVGRFAATSERPLVDAALSEGRIIRDGEAEWREGVPVRAEAVPVRRGDSLVGVIERSTNLQGVRTPSRLELAYLRSASELTTMVAEGRWPHPGDRGDHVDSPRVGDGLVRIDPTGVVEYASPNAHSVYRRLGLAGDLDGLVLADVTRSLVPAEQREDEAALSGVLSGRASGDIEIGNDEAMVALRSIPLLTDAVRTGALVLLRDVTELRRRDRELLSKDATIREVHHRVKNNLQTVAALLRLQSRRLGAGAGKTALDEAVRRVAAIAVVHETLSQSFDDLVEFDDVADQLAQLITDVGGRADAVRIQRQGTFGELTSDLATPLAMALTELLQNAVEHGYPPGTTGMIAIACERTGDSLRVKVIDDGAGVPAGFDPAESESLGLSIVRTLVAELGGTLSIGPGSAGAGTAAAVDVPL